MIRKRLPQSKFIMVVYYWRYFCCSFDRPVYRLKQVVCINMFLLFINNWLFTWGKNIISYCYLSRFSIAIFITLVVILTYKLCYFDHLFLVQFSYSKSSYLILIHIYSFKNPTVRQQWIICRVFFRRANYMFISKVDIYCIFFFIA